MKAREYFNKYVDRVKAETLEGSRKVVDDIYSDFCWEFTFKVTDDDFKPTSTDDLNTLISKTAEVETLKKDEALVKKADGIVEELNNKWNTLRAIFMKELKFTIMEKDEFLTRFKKDRKVYFNIF